MGFVSTFSNRQRAAAPQLPPIDAVSINFDTPTPHQVSLHLPSLRTLAAGTKIAVRYRETAVGAWRQGHPAVPIKPGLSDLTFSPGTVVDGFGVVVFNVQQNTPVDVELTMDEPGQQTKRSYVSTTTKALPVTGGTTRTANSQATFAAQYALCGPGDVLEFSGIIDFTSTFSMNNSGATGNPITLRGATRDSTLRRVGAGDLFAWTASNVVVERCTLQGPAVDGGNPSTSQAVRYQGNFSNVTWRDLNVLGFDVGFRGDWQLTGCMVYNCYLSGNNKWNSTTTRPPGNNLTWDDDGICLAGLGNVAFNNTVEGHGDAFAHGIDGIVSIGVHYYDNLIPWTMDDACEGDKSTRNCSWYRNFTQNSGTAISLDQLFGGPFFDFLNTAINTVRGPWKLNSTLSGHLHYHNTVVHTDGTLGWAWVQFNNGSTHENWAFVNNCTIYVGTGNMMAYEPFGNTVLDFTHNAWHSDGGQSFWWTNSGGTFTSLAAALSGLPATSPLFGTATQRHFGDVITTAAPFVGTVTLGADESTLYTGQPDLTIATGQTPKNAGRYIPGINDGYTSLDMGSHVPGVATLNFGCGRRIGPIALSAPEAEGWAVATQDVGEDIWLVSASDVLGPDSAGFTPPFSLPTTVNTSVGIGTNSMLSVAPSPYGPGAPDAWYNATINGFAGAVYCPLFTPGGAQVYSGTGGHFDGSCFGLVYFDYTDATWKYQGNGNGVAETGSSLNIAGTSGYPYYEINGSGGMPAQAHLYTLQIHLPQGPKGKLLRFTAAGVCFESVLSPATHWQDLNTRVWSRATNDTTRSDGETNGSDGINNGFEFGCHYDPVAGRVYLTSFGKITNMSHMRYLRLSDMTVQSTANFTGADAEAIVEFFSPQSWIYPDARMLLHYNGVGGDLMGLDLTNDSTITAGWKRLTQSGTQPAHGAKPTWHPVNGKFYYTPPFGEGLYSLTPPAGDKFAGTWAWSSITVGGAGFPARTLGNGHYSNLEYISSIGMLGWLYGVNAGDVRIIKV